MSVAALLWWQIRTTPEILSTTRCDWVPAQIEFTKRLPAWTSICWICALRGSDRETAEADRLSRAGDILCKASKYMSSLNPQHRSILLAEKNEHKVTIRPSQFNLIPNVKPWNQSPGYKSIICFMLQIYLDQTVAAPMFNEAWGLEQIGWYESQIANKLVNSWSNYFEEDISND